MDLPAHARAVLTRPDFVARCLAGRERDPQPRAMRESYVADVIDA